MTEAEVPIIVFELGHLQVFGMQTMSDFNMGFVPYRFYWQKKGAPTVYGPFASVNQAVSDYGQYIRNENDQKVGVKSNVIQVDFRNKKRIK